MSKVPYKKSVGLSSLQIDYKRLIELQSMEESYNRSNNQERPYRKIKTNNDHRVMKNPRNSGGNRHD